jgi:proline iminopeptidase
MPAANAPIAMNNHLHTLALAGLLGLTGCTLHDPETPGSLVPPTADQDPALPQLRVAVAGRQRSLHLQTFGNPAHPVAFVLPGGPGEDFRLLLPLKALSDRYFVVMWDQRGAGLSERVPKEELYLESFNEEIEQVRQAHAPGRPVTLIGHSYGGNLAVQYAVDYPGAVAQLVLIEPGPMDQNARDHYDSGMVGFRDGQDFFWQNQVLTSRDHTPADYKAVALMREASRGFTCTGEVPPEYPLWRFGAYYYYIIQKNVRAAGKGLNWAEGLDQPNGGIVLLTGTCGAAAVDFQRTYNLPVLPGARVVTIPGAGHIDLFTRYAHQTVGVLQDHLAAYQ